MNGTARIVASVLTIMVIASGCGSDAAQHSVPAVVRCLRHHDMRAAVKQEPPPDFNLLDIRGTIIAHLGTAMVSIAVTGSGENIAEYSPNGTAAPLKLVEAVWACAGHHVTTTPDSCDEDGCTSSY